MNLGVEDAFVFSRLVLWGGLSRYDRLRRATDQLVVTRVERLTRMARGESWISRFMRTVLLPVLVRITPIRNFMIGIVTGLDHDVEREGRAKRR